MSIHIQQVLDYLDTHPICREAFSQGILAGMLLMTEVNRLP